ncbi:ABC transporter ATP-binding protein [Mameliella alba]|uniref:ABC transporter, permease/ATP-binding protein n=1 Tax=Mameliella alba TaxID=561184 RepID=A0A0B3RQJ9_9RHOB|nr:ABC transporter ATP-binding protein [Mameliella alba]KHQ50142.1 ABC transporter, permease/ATP-binding protein [Mameliella alba]
MKLRRVLRLGVPYRVGLATALLFQLIETGAALVIPWVAGQLAGGLLNRTDFGIAPVVLGLIGLIALRTALRIAGGITILTIAERMLADLRTRLYEHFQSLPVRYFHTRRPGDQMAVLTRDVDNIAGYLTGDMVAVLPTVLTLVGALVLMLRLDPALAWPLALAVPVFVLVAKLAYRSVRGLSRDQRGTYGAAISLAEENLAILPAIKTFSQEAREAARYAGLVHRLKGLSIRLGCMHVATGPSLRFIAAAAVITVLWLSSVRVQSGDLPVGELVSLLLYAGLLTEPVSGLASLWGRTETVRGALERFEAVLDEPAEDLTSGLRPETITGEIRFDTVSFAHAGRKGTLDAVSLTVPAGRVLALTGENGAGKSTLVDMILRFNDPDSGRVLLDGTDIQELNLAALRGLIGVVPQQTLLFDGTVRDNIVFGRNDVTEDSLMGAARLARADQFIRELPDGLDTMIGSRGVRLSGGQRQRIALARALVKDPPILILDEPTAMFDPEGEAAFVNSARDALAGRTVILITHRPASLALADQTVRLAEGRIVQV